MALSTLVDSCSRRSSSLASRADVSDGGARCGSACAAACGATPCDVAELLSSWTVRIRDEHERRDFRWTHEPRSTSEGSGRGGDSYASSECATCAGVTHVATCIELSSERRVTVGGSDFLSCIFSRSVLNFATPCRDDVASVAEEQAIVWSTPSVFDPTASDG